MKQITDRQKEVLTFIANFTEENVYPPTVREISEHFKISIRAVQDHIIALQKKGYLSTEQKRSRSIRVSIRADLRCSSGLQPLHPCPQSPHWRASTA